MTPLSPAEINFTGATHAILYATKPIQVLVTTFITGIDGKHNKNVFYLFPTETYSNCYSFIANNCENSVCALVSAESSGRPDLYYRNGQIKLSNDFLKRVNDTDYVWEIRNLTNGLYFLRAVYENESLIFFNFDSRSGDFSVAFPNINVCCDCLSVPNSTIENQENMQGATDITTKAGDTYNFTSVTTDDNVATVVTDSLASNTSSSTTTFSNSSYNSELSSLISESFTRSPDPFNATLDYTTNQTTHKPNSYLNTTISQKSNCSNDMINCTERSTNTSDTTNEELPRPSYQSQSNASITVDISGDGGDDGQPNYDYLYHEAPEDDSILQDYMTAVIVSLCVAIFAVIAVISTFLLLEFVSRRKQLRNTKIRPFVSWKKCDIF